MSEPELVRDRDVLRARLRPARAAGQTIGLVPTMGFLHEGHLSLLRACREHCDLVVMSLFVNPAQFGPSEDLAAYPRDEQRDLRLAGDEGVDMVYAPSAEHVYPTGFATTVEVGGGLTDILCGDPRLRGPEHFRGVTTVVAKLFAMVGPDVAYFGQKDAQQAVVIRRMTTDLDLPVRIVVCPTVREPDGLALSSRNIYLSDTERVQARSLYRALRTAEQAETNSTAEALAKARDVLVEAEVNPEYLQARDAETLVSVERFDQTPVLIAVAARIGRARLIDNVVVS